MAIKNLISYTYSRSLVELSQLIVGFEDEVSYNLAQYFLDELNYKIGFSDTILNKLEDKKEFSNYYKKLNKIFEEEKIKELSKENMDKVYALFKEKAK